MVLEHIFPEDWLERKGLYAFLLGIMYSFVGILISFILFPGDPALVAVAFTSLLLLPELYKLFSIEERQESMENEVSIRNLWKDDAGLIRTYVLLFFGILLVYSVATIVLPSFQTNNLFREQLEVRFGQGFAGNTVGQAINFSSGLFYDLLGNNFLVMMACFVLALLTGDGAIFLITWNASVWGTIFGVTARNAALVSGDSAFYLFGIIMLVVFPHMLLEILCYICAAISGAVISKDVILEEFASERFYEVFTFNLYLLLVAIGFLLVGVIVETFVLGNIEIYKEIIELAKRI